MAFDFNGNVPKNVIFNNNNVQKIIYNNEIIYEKGYTDEIITIFPFTFNTTESILKNYKIYGNSTQNGDCGEKTSNLYDKTKTFANVSSYISANGSKSSNSAFNITGYYEVMPNTKYMLEDVNISSANPAVCFYNSNKEYISGVAYNKQSYCKFTTPEDCYFIKFSVNKSLIDTTQLHLGNTAISYEPFGYKIPVNINNIIIPIYLDEPLRKINDVADYINFGKQKRYTYINNGQILQVPIEQNITIPEIETVIRNNSLDFETTVKPSKIQIKYKVGKILPDEYQQVEYLETTGSQYINTDYLPNNNTKIELTYMLTAMPTQIVFGSRADADSSRAYNGVFITHRSATAKVAWGKGANSNLEIQGYNDINTQYTAFFDKNKVFFNDNLVYNFSDIIWEGNYPIFVGCVNTKGRTEFYAKCKYYGFKIWNENVLDRYLIPCYRKLDNVAGFYDLVNDVFYTNEGTGEFIVGEDI